MATTQSARVPRPSPQVAPGLPAGIERLCPRDVRWPCRRLRVSAEPRRLQNRMSVSSPKADITGHHSSSGSNINPWLSTTLAVLRHRHVDAGAALTIDQFDRLGHWVGIFAAVLHCLRSAGRCRPYAGLAGCGFFLPNQEQNPPSRVSALGGRAYSVDHVLSRDYFLNQVASLLKFAKETTNPQLAAVLIAKAADLKSQVDESSTTPQAPDVGPDTRSQT
jgi:hypothetical protein